MPTRVSRPSLTSLITFFLIVSPIVYVLSYAPVVRVLGRTVETRMNTADLNVPFRQASTELSLPAELVLRDPVADASLYPMYRPVDWLIDHTPVRDPLFYWADVWGVRREFEWGHLFRPRRPSSEVGP